MSESTQTLDTFPKLLMDHAKRRANKPAIREKDFGIWQEWTWSQYADEARALAHGLAAKGFGQDSKLAIIGANRPQLYAGMAAAHCLGGVAVPMYADSVAEEMVYILQNADISMALVEDQEQVDKMIEIKNRCPLLQHVIYKDSRGLRNYIEDYLSSYAEIQQQGRDYERQHPDFLEQKIGAGKGSDIASISYTSGTTGNPKGVMLTYDNLIKSSANAIKFENLKDDEEIIAYMPMAWIGQSVFSYAQHFCAGYCVNCPESSETLLMDIREIAPTYFFAPPSVWESLLTQVMIRIEDASKSKKKMFHYFMEHARKVGVGILEGNPVSGKDRWLYRLGELCVYGPLKNVLGLSKVRLAYTAGEAIGPDIFDFYRGLGINIKQLYGSTEASVFVSIQPDGEIKPDTVGKPAIDVEIKITDNGEVLFRSPGVFHSYYKNPEATAETKDGEGWVHTGDAGYIGTDGHLRIIDRAKDVGKLTNGTMFPPKYIENKLKFFQYIKEVVAFGHERDYVNVFINIDLEAVGNWAERRGIPYSGYTDLAARDEVYDLVKDCVQQVNTDLAADERLSACQIKRFLILHKELEADDGELTRTSKVRRGFIADKYGELVSALYSDRDVYNFEAQVTFEDGRTGTLKADVKIRDTEPVSLQQAA